MKIYYAHPMSWYNSVEELHDVAALNENFDEVVNPNCDRIQEELMIRADLGLGGPMGLFMHEVQQCDALAFRTFKDGGMSAGVAKEYLEAICGGKPPPSFL